MPQPFPPAADAIRLAARAFLWTLAGLTAAMAAALSTDHVPTCLSVAAPHCAYCYAAAASLFAALTSEIATRR